MVGLPKIDPKVLRLVDEIYKAQCCPEYSEKSLKWAKKVFEKRPITIFFGDPNTPGTARIIVNEIGEIITHEGRNMGCKVETLAHIAYKLVRRIRRNNPMAEYPRWGFRYSERVTIWRSAC